MPDAPSKNLLIFDRSFLKMGAMMLIVCLYFLRVSDAARTGCRFH